MISAQFKQPFLCVPVLELLYSCLKKIPWDRNVAALFDDEVCVVKNCQLFLLIVFRKAESHSFWSKRLVVKDLD